MPAAIPSFLFTNSQARLVEFRKGFAGESLSLWVACYDLPLTEQYHSLDA